MSSNAAQLSGDAQFDPGVAAHANVAGAPPHLQRMYEAYSAAVHGRPELLSLERFVFAGRPVVIRTAGRQLAYRTTRAFAHLTGSVSIATPAGLQVHLWDETETGVSCAAGDSTGEKEWIACGGTLSASPDGRYVTFRYRDSVTCLDRHGRLMIGCRGNGSHLAGGEYSKPLLLMLSIWYYDRGVQLLHAGLVAREDAGVLLPGESGTGKSTTCLASITQGLLYLGDDFVGLESAADGSFRGHSIFNTACVAATNLYRFPELETRAVLSASPEEEKPILFLSEIHPQRLRPTVPVRSVVLVRIRQERTEVRRATRPEALRAFAASTLHTVVPRPGRDALRMLGEVVERVPAYWLLLGPDIADVGPGMDEVLARATGSDAP